MSDDEALTSTTTEPSATAAAAADDDASELKATPEMCYHCFDVLLEKLKTNNNNNNSTFTRELKNFRQSSSSGTNATISGRSTPVYVDSLPSESLECPLFVTWEKQKQQQQPHLRRCPDPNNATSTTTVPYELRGCIGTLAPKPLASCIGEYALLSALRDQRFRPIQLAELPQLRVSVSLLVQYEDCAHCYDWTVGTHGIIIKFYANDHHHIHNENDEHAGDDDAEEEDGRSSGPVRGRELSATFLPEVAFQQNWDQTTTVQSLIRKAGFKGTITSSLVQKIRCTRYQSSKCKISFDEYVQHHGSAGEWALLSSGGSHADSTGSQSNCQLM